jgi:ribosomal protein S18 acetylase RimI-like enzyme
VPRIRPYREEDWDAFLALDLETGRATIRASPSEERARFEARWSLHLRSEFAWGDAGPTKDNALLLILEDDDAAYAGHLWLCEKEDTFSGAVRLYVNTVAVVEKFRSRGWGRLLMQRAIEEAKARGLESVGLAVAADNVVARKLYEEMGFLATRIAMVRPID